MTTFQQNYDQIDWGRNPDQKFIDIPLRIPNKYGDRVRKTVIIRVPSDGNSPTNDDMMLANEIKRGIFQSLKLIS